MGSAADPARNRALSTTSRAFALRPSFPVRPTAVWARHRATSIGHAAAKAAPSPMDTSTGTGSDVLTPALRPGGLEGPTPRFLPRRWRCRPGKPPGPSWSLDLQPGTPG